MYYTRIMGAEHQINEAIWLFFQARTPIGCYVLISAAHEVIQSMLKAQRKTSIMRELRGTPGQVKTIQNNINLTYNKLKHAKIDPHIDIEELDFEEIEPRIYLACKIFFTLTDGYTQTMQIFVAWFIACHPQKIAPDKEDYLKKAQEYFQNIHEITMKKRQKMGLDMLIKYHDRPELEMPIMREWPKG